MPGPYGCEEFARIERKGAWTEQEDRRAARHHHGVNECQERGCGCRGRACPAPTVARMATNMVMAKIAGLAHAGSRERTRHHHGVNGGRACPAPTVARFGGE
jgi:hypothetical protein